MPTVQDIANQYHLNATINRALSFHPGRIDTRVLFRIPVQFSPHLSRAAGNFHRQPHLQINLHYGLQRAGEEALIETFLHELAHAMQHLRYGVCDHGATWWEMMHQLGQQPKRCHNIAECRPATGTKAQHNPDDLGL